MDAQSDRQDGNNNNNNNNPKGVDPGSCDSLLEDFKRIDRPFMPVMFISGAASNTSGGVGVVGGGGGENGKGGGRLQHFLQKPFTHRQLLKNVSEFILKLNKK
jgi:hypothetical protein